MPNSITKDKNLIVFEEEEKGRKGYLDCNTGNYYGTRKTLVTTVPIAMRKCLEWNRHSMGYNRFTASRATPMEMLRQFFYFTYNFNKWEERQAYISKWIYHVERFANVGLYLDAWAMSQENEKAQEGALSIPLSNTFVTYIKGNFDCKVSVMACNRYLIGGKYIERIEAISQKYDDPTTVRSNLTAYLDDTVKRAGQYPELIGLYEYLLDQADFMYICEYDRWTSLFETLRNYMMKKPFEIPKKKDFLRLFLEVVREARILEQKEMNEKIQKNAHPELFEGLENDKYIIIVPTSVSQVKDEAVQQENCLFRAYLGNIANGDSIVCFIRRRDMPNKSFITAMFTRNGRLEQAAYARNNGLDGSDRTYVNTIATQIQRRIAR